MAKAISTLNDVKKVSTEFIDKNPYIFEKDGKAINTIQAVVLNKLSLNDLLF